MHDGRRADISVLTRDHQTPFPEFRAAPASYGVTPRNWLEPRLPLRRTRA